MHMNAQDLLKCGVICSIVHLGFAAAPAWSAPVQPSHKVHKVDTRRVRAHQVRPHHGRRGTVRAMSHTGRVVKRPTPRTGPIRRKGLQSTARALVPVLTSNAFTVGRFAACPSTLFGGTQDLAALPFAISFSVASAASSPTVTSGPAELEPVASTIGAAAIEAVDSPTIEIGAPPIAEVAPPPIAEVVPPPIAEVVPSPTTEVGAPPTAEVGAPPAAEVVAPPTAETITREREPVAWAEPPVKIVAPQGLDAVSFIGLVEAQLQDLRVAVLRIGSRVVYGREGQIVAGRYRLLTFSEDAAEVFDIRSAVTRTLAMGAR